MVIFMQPQGSQTKQFSLHVLGGRNGKISNSTPRDIGRLRERYREYASVDAIYAYYRARGGEDVSEEPGIPSWKKHQEGCGEIQFKVFNTVEEMVNLFVENAKKDIAKGEVPVLLVAAKYETSKPIDSLDRATFRLDDNPDERLKCIQDELEKLENLDVIVASTEDIGIHARTSAIIGQYHGIRELGSALKKHSDTETIAQCLCLILTNPTEITPLLFAEASGINPEHILAPSDVDRTRFFYELEQLVKHVKPVSAASLPHETLHELNARINAYGPHNALNRATRQSIREVMQFLSEHGYSFKGNGITPLPFEEMYKQITDHVNQLGLNSIDFDQEVCEDTVKGIIYLLHALFPMNASIIRQNRDFFPQRVKAQVYDPDLEMFVGDMIERDEYVPSADQNIRAALGGQALSPRYYRRTFCYADNELDTVDFNRGVNSTKAVIDAMKTAGLLTGKVNRSVIKKRERENNRSQVPIILTTPTTPTTKLQECEPLPSGEYVITGIVFNGKKHIGIFDKYVDDNPLIGEGLVLRHAIFVKFTPRSFAYDPENATLLVGTGEGVQAVNMKDGTQKTVLDMDITGRGNHRYSGCTSIAIHQGDVLATVPGRGIVHVKNYNTASPEEHWITCTDQYVGAVKAETEGDTGNIGVAVGKGVFLGAFKDIPRTLDLLMQAEGYHSVEGTGLFAVDDWVMKSGELYAISNDGIVYKANDGKLSEVVYVFGNEQGVYKERERKAKERERKAKGDDSLAVSLVVRERVQYGRHSKDTAAYTHNLLWENERMLVSVQACDKANNIVFLGNEEVPIRINDYDHAAYRLLVRVGDRMLAVAPQTFGTVPGCFRFTEKVSDPQLFPKPLGFGAAEVCVNE